MTATTAESSARSPKVTYGHTLKVSGKPGYTKLKRSRRCDAYRLRRIAADTRQDKHTATRGRAEDWRQKTPLLVRHRATCLLLAFVLLFTLKLTALRQLILNYLLQYMYFEQTWALIYFSSLEIHDNPWLVPTTWTSQMWKFILNIPSRICDICTCVIKPMKNL